MKSDRRKKVLLASSVLIAALLLSELAVRIFHLGPEIAPVYWNNYRVSENPVLGYELVPGSKDGETIINSDGMRDRERSTEKPPNTIRIACIGDSICYGLEVPQSQAFPARLETILNEYYANSGINFEVMNFGVTGYNINQTVENLRSRALKYKPDIIVYAYCLNEPQDYSFEMASVRAMMTNAQKQYIDSSFSRSLMKSRLFLLTRYAIRSATKGGQTKSKAPQLRKEEKVWSSLYSGTYPEYFASLYSDKEAWSSVETGLSELSQISRNQKIPVFVSVFPVLMHFDKYPLSRIHQQVSQSCARNALEVIDLLDILSQYETINKKKVGWDALHPNKDGHGVVAIALFMDLTSKDPLRKLPKPTK